MAVGKPAPLPTVPFNVSLCIQAQASALQSSSWTRLLVFVRFQLELVGGDLAILVAILILNMSPMVFSGSWPGRKGPLPLTDLSLDEGGKLQRGEPERGRERLA